MVLEVDTSIESVNTENKQPQSTKSAFKPPGQPFTSVTLQQKFISMIALYADL